MDDRMGEIMNIHRMEKVEPQKKNVHIHIHSSLHKKLVS